MRGIARNLNRALSTISREIKRHRNKNTAKYSPDKTRNGYR
ncbi:helix-turn-helix domain-containing protein [Ligilactobacillus acidipiscis]